MNLPSRSLTGCHLCVLSNCTIQLVLWHLSGRLRCALKLKEFTLLAVPWKCRQKWTPTARLQQQIRWALDPQGINL